MAGVQAGPAVPILGRNGQSQNTFNAALETGATDYDRMMQAYQALAAQATGPGAASTQQLAYTPITPALQQYQQGGAMTDALSQYQGATQTGGYTPEGLAAIRARGVSPIRSIYASAQRNIEQDRSLQGGYSPNFNAASTKMAREMSERLSAASTAIEADIADRVAKGKATSLSGYAQLATEADRSRNSVDAANASSTNQANALNAQMPLEYARTNATLKSGPQDQAMRAIQGQANLYGTTPANAALYGGLNMQGQQMAQTGAIQGAQLKQQAANSQNQLASSLLGNYQPRFG